MGEFALGTDEIGGETRVEERSEAKLLVGEIRRAVPSDLERLFELVEAAMDHPWTRGQVASALEHRHSRVVLALEEPTAREVLPIGFVFARRISDLLEIDLVGVAPGCRRAGVGRAMLTNLLDAERSGGQLEARLELAASNRAARALYEGLGFMVVGRRSRYYPDGDDALLLTKAFE